MWVKTLQAVANSIQEGACETSPSAAARIIYKTKVKHGHRASCPANLLPFFFLLKVLALVLGVDKFSDPNIGVLSGVTKCYCCIPRSKYSLYDIVSSSRETVNRNSKAVREKHRWPNSFQNHFTINFCTSHLESHLRMLCHVEVRTLTRPLQHLHSRLF